MSSKDKKDEDLTRIEDLGEFLHELSEDEDDDSPPEFSEEMMDFDAPTDPKMEISEDFYSEKNTDEEESFEENEFSSSEEENNFSFNNEDSNEEESFGDFEESNDFSALEDSLEEDNNDFSLSEELDPLLEDAHDDEVEELTQDFNEDLFEDELDIIDEEDLSEASEPFDVVEKAMEKTPLPRFEPGPVPTKPEDFSEIKNFAANASYENLSSEGNPPFSVIIKDIHFLEDIKEIIQVLVQTKIIQNDEIERAESGLLRGTYLISRISEFAAIFLCHKLRRFNITTLMGQSSEIHPSSVDDLAAPIVSKLSVYQNRQESISLENKLFDPKKILASTTSQIHNHHILKYIDIISEHIIVDMDDLNKNFSLEEELNNHLSDMRRKEKWQLASIKGMNELASASSYLTEEDLQKESKVSTDHGLKIDDFYKTLIDKLKTKAISLNANGIIGISFMIHPMLKEDIYSKPRYQISATGNAVWVKPV